MLSIGAPGRRVELGASGGTLMVYPGEGGVVERGVRPYGESWQHNRNRNPISRVCGQVVASRVGCSPTVCRADEARKDTHSHGALWPLTWHDVRFSAQRQTGDGQST